MYGLRNVNIFTELCNYHPSLILGDVNYPKKTPKLVSYVLNPYSHNQSQTTTNHFVSTDFLNISYK